MVGVVLKLRFDGSYKARAMRFRVVYERFNILEVFHRDHWRCQICGCPTPSNLRGTTDKQAPELDHIIPLSKGGPHTKENSQCACRGCNMRKGNRVPAIPKPDISLLPYIPTKPKVRRRRAIKMHW